jgi:hypothetical protein
MLPYARKHMPVLQAEEEQTHNVCCCMCDSVLPKEGMCLPSQRKPGGHTVSAATCAQAHALCQRRSRAAGPQDVCRCICASICPLSKWKQGRRTVRIRVAAYACLPSGREADTLSVPQHVCKHLPAPRVENERTHACAGQCSCMCCCICPLT